LQEEERKPMTRDFSVVRTFIGLEGQKEKNTDSIQTSHVLTNHTTIWTCTSLTSPIETRGGAVSLI
jgi:hypothetical protein